MNDQQKRFQAALQEIYKKQDTIEPLIEGLESDGEVPQNKMKDYYIPLQIKIGKDETKENGSEKILSKGQEIEIESIFDKQPGGENAVASQSGKVLIVGPAGIGNSTLTKYMAYKWGEGKLWNDRFDYVYRIPLKPLLESNSGSTSQLLKQLVYNYFKPFFEEEGLEITIETMAWLDKNKPALNNRILLLLDGDDGVTDKKALKDKIFKEMLDFNNVILTSRPDAMDQKMADNFKRNIENAGLGPAGINKYFSSYFQDDQQKGKELQSFLAEKPTIRDICNIPVNIAMLCFIWSKKTEANLNISSLSDLYHHVVNNLGFRHNINPRNGDLVLGREISRDEVIVLQHLAYRSLIGPEIERPDQKRSPEDQKIKGQIVADDEDGLAIESSICYLKEKLSNKLLSITIVYGYGLLKADKHNSGRLSEETLRKATFTFLHSSFQEYLAAKYLVEQLKSGEKEEQAKIANFIARHRNEPRLALILKFMAGILRASPNENDKIIRATRIFWDAILCNPKGALELGIDAKVNLLMNLLGQAFKNGVIDPRIPNQDLAVQVIDCRVLENILLWTKELKESDYISSNIKEGLLKIFLEDDLSWSRNKSQDISQALSSNLKRMPLEKDKEILVKQNEESENTGLPVPLPNVDQKLIRQEIGGAVSSLILKFTTEEQDKIIKKLFEEIESRKGEVQVKKKSISAIIKISQMMEFSPEDSQTLIKILLGNIFDENLGKTARDGVVEILKASEEPASLKEHVKQALRETKFYSNSKFFEAKLKAVIEVALIISSDHIDFIREIVKIMKPLLNNQKRYEMVASKLIELMEGCEKNISSEILDDIVNILFPTINKDITHFSLSSITSLMDSKTMKTNKEGLKKVANHFVSVFRLRFSIEVLTNLSEVSNDVIVPIREESPEEFYRNLSVVKNLIPRFFEVDKQSVEDIARIFTLQLKRPEDNEIITSLGKMLEIIAGQYGGTNLRLSKKMIKSLTRALRHSDEKIRKQVVGFITTIAQHSQDSRLCHNVIKTLRPLLHDEDEEICTNTLGCIIKLFQASKNLDSVLFNTIMNTLIKEVDTFDPSKQNASSEAIKNLVSKSGNINSQGLKYGVNALMSLARKTRKTNKREVALDTILDLATDNIQDNDFIKELIKEFTSQMKAQPKLKARLEAIVIQLREIIEDQDKNMIKDAFEDLTQACALKGPDDTKLISVKNMLGIFKKVLATGAGSSEKAARALRPLLKANDATLRAATVFYMTEIFQSNEEKEIRIMNEILPDLVGYFQHKDSSGQLNKLQQKALLGVVRLLEISNCTDIEKTKSILNVLKNNKSEIEKNQREIENQKLLHQSSIQKNKAQNRKRRSTIMKPKNQSSLHEMDFTASMQSIIRAYSNADNEVLKGMLEFLKPLVNDEHIGKVISEEIASLLIKRDHEMIKDVDRSLNEFLKRDEPYSKVWIFKLKLDIIRQQNPVDLQQIDNYISTIEFYLQNKNPGIKQSAFAYIVEAVKVKNLKLVEYLDAPNDELTDERKNQMKRFIEDFNTQNEQLIQNLNQTLRQILSQEKGKQLQENVPSNIVDFLRITANKDKQLLKEVLEFFIASPQSDSGEEEEERNCSWILKLLRAENDKAILDQALKEMIPRLGLTKHSGLVQRLSIHVLQHIDLVEKYLDLKDNPDLRKSFRAGMLHYLKNYLERFNILEKIFPENRTDRISSETIKVELLAGIRDKDDFIRRTWNFEFESNDNAALRNMLIAELDQAETREGIEIVQVALVVIAKVEYSKYEVEKQLPDVAWQVIVKALKYFREQKLGWIYNNLDGIAAFAAKPTIAEAVFGKLYHKILGDGVISPLEEKLIIEFIHRGLATSMTKKEITFQDVKYEMKGNNINFILENIARVIIQLDKDLLAKQYETNTPLFKKSYQDEEENDNQNRGNRDSMKRIQGAAVDIGKIISAVDTKFVLRNDFWVLSYLNSMSTGSELILLEQRSAFGDHVVYKSEGAKQKFVELPENFTLEDVFGKYQPGLMFNGRTKVLSSSTGQELAKGNLTEFDKIEGSLEDSDFYYQEELLKIGKWDRIMRTLAQKANNPLATLQNFLKGIPDGERIPLQQYYEGFMVTFSSAYLVSKIADSSVFQINPIEAEMSAPTQLFTKLVSFIPYGIGEKISTGIQEALNYVAKNEFKNNNKFMAELASDPVDLSCWIGEIALKRLELSTTRQQIMTLKEDDVVGWTKKVLAIQNAITEWIAELKMKVVQRTGEDNLIVKEIEKSLAFRLGQSEANQMMQGWFKFCHTQAGQFTYMTQDGKRDLFTQNFQNNPGNVKEISNPSVPEKKEETNNPPNQNDQPDQTQQEERKEEGEEMGSQKNPTNASKEKNNRIVSNKNETTLNEENQNGKDANGRCEECNIF